MKTGREIALAIFGALLIAAGAQVFFPLEPIATTLQTLALVAIGLLGGPRIGGFAALFYLLLVLFGLPVLSRGQQIGGWDFVEYLGAGYVIGFIPGAALAGWLGHRQGFWRCVLAGFAAHAVVLVCGAAVMVVWLGLGLAIERGLIPFIPGAVAKSLVAAALAWLVAAVIVGRRGSVKVD